jgi:hypothetical protein
MRVVDLEVYPTPAGTRHAAIWYQSCDNTTWADVSELDRGTYDQQKASYEQRGFRIVDLESYQTPGGQRYATLWEQVRETTAWADEVDLDMTGFLNFHRRYEDEGLRLVDFESYDTSDGIRYAGVWTENEPRHDYSFVADVDQAIETYRKTYAIPGISVAIIRNGEYIYRRGFGRATSATAGPPRGWRARRRSTRQPRLPRSSPPPWR